MNIPADLLYTQQNSGKGDRCNYVKNLGKELREVRKRVTPFNPATRQPSSNPVQEGELIYQQQMDKTHKLSLRWRGPFKITKIINSFQITYDEQGRKKITHISNCKRFYDWLVGVGAEIPPPGGEMLKAKRRVFRQNCQRPSSSRYKMSLCHFEVRVRDMTHDFHDTVHILQWLQGEEEASTVVCVQGVPVQGGTGSQDVTDFFYKELRLVRLPGRLQKRALRHLKNRCGLRFSEEGAVCQAQEEYHEEGGWESHGESLGESGTDDVSSICARIGSPTHLLTSSPAHLLTPPDSSQGI